MFIFLVSAGLIIWCDFWAAKWPYEAAAHPVLIKGSKHTLCVLRCFAGGSHAEELLKFMQKQKAARALVYKLFIHVLKRNDVNLCVFGFLKVLSLSHVFSSLCALLKPHPESRSHLAAGSQWTLVEISVEMMGVKEEEETQWRWSAKDKVTHYRRHCLRSLFLSSFRLLQMMGKWEMKQQAKLFFWL